jgi:chromosome segregation ATPase
MNNKDDLELNQVAQTITNIIDVDDEDEQKKASKKTREAYRHITLRGVVLLSLGAFIAGGLGSCALINTSMERYHALVLERDIITQKNMREVLDANQNSLDAMRDSLEKLAVSGLNYTPEYIPPVDLNEVPQKK